MRPAATLDVYCTSEELIEAVGSPSLARIQQTMGQLSSLGLLAESNKPSYVAVTDKVKTRATPTALGLKMFARCHGHQSWKKFKRVFGDPEEVAEDFARAEEEALRGWSCESDNLIRV